MQHDSVPLVDFAVSLVDLAVGFFLGGIYPTGTHNCTRSLSSRLLLFGNLKSASVKKNVLEDNLVTSTDTEAIRTFMHAYY